MKCLLCERWSFSHICKKCQHIYLQPSLYKRKVGSVDVLSFYKYSDIKELLFTKHTPLGYYIYSILAQNSFALFSKNFTFSEKVASLSIDDHNRSGYSHTALLNRSLKSAIIEPYYGRLRAKNSINYAGKSVKFRRENPRDFTYKRVKEKSVILVDDIITTGLTLSEAIENVEGSDLLFCLTLADVELKNENY